MKQKITIGIAAYNAEGNIVPLIQALVEQTDFSEIVSELIVHSDASSDQTVELARAFKHPKIRVIANTQRVGFAKSVIRLLKTARTEAVLLLNDDIAIADKQFLKKITNPLSTETNLGIISGNPQPLSAKSFVERAGILSHRIYVRMRYSLPSIHNKYTCDGKVLLLTRKFIQALTFPTDVSKMGNVDAYLYFACLQKGFRYYHVREAVVLFRYPSTVTDYLRWQVRNNTNALLLKAEFGDFITKEYKMPKNYFSYLTRKEIMSNIKEILFLVFVHFYVDFKKKSVAKSFNPTWEVIQTSKQITH